jgi:hypothetical protein
MDILAVTSCSRLRVRLNGRNGCLCVHCVVPSALLQQLSRSALTIITQQIAPSTIPPHSKTKSFWKVQNRNFETAGSMS